MFDSSTLTDVSLGLARLLNSLLERLWYCIGITIL
jgi:hypothetical protein